MNKICTDIEQSRRLLKLGLDPSTADMFYNLGESQIPNVIYGSNDDFKCYIPAWSLAAILELMPFFITIKEEGEPDEYYHFQLNREDSVFRSKWRASYHGLKTERGKVHTRRIHWAVGPKRESDTPIDAAFEMVVWLIENRYIKKTI